MLLPKAQCHLSATFKNNTSKLQTDIIKVFYNNIKTLNYSKMLQKPYKIINYIPQNNNNNHNTDNTEVRSGRRFVLFSDEYKNNKVI